jgi:hypothetical protein
MIKPWVEIRFLFEVWTSLMCAACGPALDPAAKADIDGRVAAKESP